MRAFRVLVVVPLDMSRSPAGHELVYPERDEFWPTKGIYRNSERFPDTMKVHWLMLFLVIGAVLTAPVVSAKTIEEKNGYIISSGEDTFLPPGISRLSSASISQGQTHWYSTLVPAGKTSFYSDLYWGVPSNSLSLTIVAPDAILGPYYDSADGLIDGRVNLKISRISGLASGTWMSGIHGYHVSGVQSYTYSVSVS